MLSIYSPSDLRKAEKAMSLLEEIIEDSPAARMSKREFLAAATAVLAASCGGSPSAPTPNPNPNPQQELAIRARLANIYTNNPFDITSARVGSVPAEISGNGDGTYNLLVKGISPGMHEALLSGSGSLERKVKLNIQDKQEYSMNTIPSNFPLEFFNVVARDNKGIYPTRFPNDPNRRRMTYPDGTVRWEQKPTFYLDLETLSTLGLYMPWFLGEIKRHINTSLPYISDNFFAGSGIVETQRSSQLPQLGTSGAWIVRGGHAEGGAAVHDEWIDNRNVIYSALVEFSKKVGPDGIAQDMCQPAGFFLDYLGTGSDSLFWDRGPAIDPTPKDNIMGTYLYRRPAGARSQDDTSHLDSIGMLALMMRVLSGRRNDRFAAIMPAVQNYREL